MMSLQDGFRPTPRRLRILVPPVWPVKVRSLPLTHVDGDCTFLHESKSGPHFSIRVNSKIAEETRVSILIHEWAHALSWGSGTHRIRDHGPEWGLAMSRIWQALVED